MDGLNDLGQHFCYTPDNNSFGWHWIEVLNYQGRQFTDCIGMNDEQFEEFVRSVTVH